MSFKKCQLDHLLWSQTTLPTFLKPPSPSRRLSVSLLSLSLSLHCSDLLQTSKTSKQLYKVVSSFGTTLTSPMTNTESNDNRVSVGGNGSVDNEKQPPAAVKKAALRDVQNENVRSNGNAVKVCGTKRLTPERPSSSSHLYMAYNGANENVMNARRRFEFELGRGKLQSMEKYSESPQLKNTSPLLQGVTQKQSHMKENHVHLVPVASQSHTTPMMTISSGGPSVPSSLGKQSNLTPARVSDYLKSSSDRSQKVDSKTSNEQLRTDRFIQLHKFLEQCDKTSQREYSEKLLNLSPAELSQHAVELEKRAIQLVLEEGEEMKRMKALNILSKSS